MSSESAALEASPFPTSKGDGGASDAVFLGIVHGLESHRFAPGQRLVETDLVAQFGVGRNSVREALQRLAAEGVVELLRHKGAAIRSLTIQDTLDVLDVAEHMTGLLAGTATRGCNDPAFIAALKGSVTNLRNADRAGDTHHFAAARRQFYRVLLDMGGSRELKRLFPGIHMPVVYAQYSLPDLQRMRLADYKAIASAVLTGSAPEAHRKGGEHVRNVRQAILASLSSKDS